MKAKLRFLLVAVMSFPLLGVLLLCLFALPAAAEAAWDPAGENTTVVYEVLPAESRVHVTITYQLRNLDQATRFDGSYYYRWTVGVEKSAANLKVYDSARSLAYTSEITARWNYLHINLGTQLPYGVSYAFKVEYDLTISQNVAGFSGYGQGDGATTLRILVPHAYYDETLLTKSGYSLGLEGANIAYVYTAPTDGWRVTTALRAARKTPFESRSGVASLTGKTVLVSVNTWAGESAKAQQALDLATRGLPLLEQQIGVTLPSSYALEIREATYQETNGAAGQNGHRQGIEITYSNLDDASVVIHELSHQWFADPYFKEAWMWEGNAELYAYLALQKMGETAEADAIKAQRTATYEANKNKPLMLSEWSYQSCPGFNDESCPGIGYGYGKSFVFMYNLYQKVGLDGLQEVNQQAIAWGKPVDWFDYLDILEATSGQELGRAFVGWVVPESFGASFDQWQAAEKSYRDARAALAAPTDRLGLSTLDSRLPGVKSRIVSSQFADALAQAQSLQTDLTQWQAALAAYRRQEAGLSAQSDTLGLSVAQTSLSRARTLLTSGRFADSLVESKNTSDLLAQWQIALVAYRQTEATVAQPSDTLGLASALTSLESAKTLLTSGRYTEVAAQLASAAALFTQWQAALSAYRQAETAVGQPQDTLGLAPVASALALARSELLAGRYVGAATQVSLVLSDLAQWKKALTAYRTAEAQVMAPPDALGLETVKTALSRAKASLESGDYSQSQDESAAVDSSLKSWQDARAAYRAAEATLGRPADVLGFPTVQDALAEANVLLIAGRFADAASQTDAALARFSEWQGALAAYRQAEAALGSLADNLGDSLVADAVAQAKALLEAGRFADALAQTAAADALRAQWQSALAAYRDAETAVQQAQADGRTWQLATQESALAAAHSLLQAGTYDQTTKAAKDITLAAQSARSPVRVFAPIAAAAGVMLLLVPIAVAFWMRMRSRKA